MKCEAQTAAAGNGRVLSTGETREFRNHKHAAQWTSTLERYASPVIGRLPVDRIELAHVVENAIRVWTSGRRQ